MTTQPQPRGADGKVPLGTTALRLSPARVAAVDRARQGWIRKLIDLSRRNNLLFFRDLKRGTLDLTDAKPEELADLVRGESVPIRNLLPEDDFVRLSANLIEIHKRAIANLEERGLETLFLALGIASWPQSDGGRSTESPVLLLPVKASAKGLERQNITLRRAGDVQVNPVLLFGLKSQHGIEISADGVLSAVQGDDEGETLDLAPTFDLVRRACSRVPDFAIAPRCLLGNFSFQKMAIVKDLEDLKDVLPGHELISALAGDTEAAGSLRGKHVSVDPRTLDTVPPDNEFLILDADSSQHTVICNVLWQQDGVIQGPPGTGKSQTIANLVAELAARGKRVLFVAEKRAALEVVLDRLQRAGLGHLALDLHGADVSRREVMAQIAESLRLIREALPPAADGVHTRFTQMRQRLVDHLEKLHTPRGPSGLSVFEMQGERLRLPAEARVTSRWRSGELQKLDGKAAEAAQDLLREASASADLFLRRGPSPWANAGMATAADVQDALARISRCLHESLPELREALARLLNATRLRKPETLAEASRLVGLVEGVNHLGSRYSTKIYNSDPDRLARDLAPAERLLASMAALVGDPTYRAALRNVRELCREKIKARGALADAREAARLLREWRSLGGSAPHAAEAVASTRAPLDRLRRDLEALAKWLTALPGPTASLEDLAHELERLEADHGSAVALPRLRAIDKELRALGLAAFLREIALPGHDPAVWSGSFRFGWLESCLERAFLDAPELGGFKGRSHDQVALEFQTLDRRRLALAAQRVRRAHAEFAISAMNEDPAAETLVRRESEKRSRHMPFRRLVQEAGGVLTRLRPCWMASPLSVSQLLPASASLFDVVLFDEASQVLPEDAMVSLYRATQAVVAGDKHQLPPTTFFAVSEDEAEQEDAALASEGFESLLDLMTAFCQPWSLDWHYRSRDESLIAFSNRHIYEDRLVTFPGSDGASAVLSHVLVNYAGGVDGQEDSVSAEVEKVVDLILEHARTRPKETLGVITMGIKHADRIDAALYRALQNRRDLESFFDGSKPEKFFVKNLERVQGDERDAIILSIGYGKDRTGRLLYRFGPLLTKGGERRLNVAITRARNRLAVVSSFSHLDMEPGRTPARGVELLRLYLEYASSGGQRLGDSGGPEVAQNDFEQDVFDALTARGIPLQPQWGVSKYRIDLAAVHRDRPGKFVLAIECDGASYHSAATARDRDRLRQQHLEALGWRFHRIWSTDWFVRRHEEIERAVAAYEDALRRADTAPATAVPPDHEHTTRRVGEPPTPLARGPRPPVPKRQSIKEYLGAEIQALLSWVLSDGRLRTDDELVEEMRVALGFERRGSRIEAAIRRAIEVARGSAGRGGR